MELTRRKLLVGRATGAAAVGTAALLSDRGSPTLPPTEALEADRERHLAERFAPDLYFGAAEAWYPADPRRYASETEDGGTVVDGFDALDGYAREVTEAADRRLRGLRTRLSAILDVIRRDRGRFPETFPALVEERVAQADRRAEQALDSPL